MHHWDMGAIYVYFHRVARTPVPRVSVQQKSSSISRTPRVNRSFCSISQNTDKNGKLIVGYHLKLHFWGPRLNFEPSQLCWDNFAIYGVLGVRVAKKGSYNVRNETNCISFFSLGQNPFGHTGHWKKKILKMGIYRKISFLSIKAEISTLDDFLALFMNRRIIFSQKMEKKFFVGNT